jgi:hypothetical protein
MEFSCAHAKCPQGGRRWAARYLGGRKAREPARRNARFIHEAGGDSVGGERKSDSHCYFWAGWPTELSEGPKASRRMRLFAVGLVQAFRVNREALPDKFL